MKLLVLTLSWVTLLCSFSPSSATRIVGGTHARAGQFPFAAAITVQTVTTRFLCTGAFVGFQWTITSGNCVNNGILFTIRLGAITLDDTSALIVATSDYVLHPDFEPETIRADIGLIRFREQVSFTEYIRPLYTWALTRNDSQTVSVLGWGQAGDGVEGYSNSLQYADVAVITNDRCRVYYGNQVTDEMVCVEGNYNEGTCIGDSGGPLYMYAISSPWVVAVASFISGNGCDSTEPSGYTRTGPYIDWIDFHVYGINRTV